MQVGSEAIMMSVQAFKFEVHSDYRPAGDQPDAINRLVEGLESGLASQTLLGVTGSGKTYTIATDADARLAVEVVVSLLPPVGLSPTTLHQLAWRTAM